jgi:O-antigen/teichoic acid export membrane protein
MRRLSPTDPNTSSALSLREWLSKSNLWMTGQQAREFAWLAGGQVVVLLLSLVTVKLVTSIGPAGYGKYILATSIGGMLSQGFFGPVEQGYIRMYFYYGQDPAKRPVYFSSLVRILVFAGGILLVAGSFVVGIGHTYYGWDLAFHAVAAVMILLLAITIPVNGMLNAMRLRKESSIIQIGERIVLIGLLLAAHVTWTLDATLVVLCTAMATGSSLIARSAIYQAHSTIASPVPDAMIDRVDVRKEIYGKIIDYVRPFMAWGAIAWIQSNGERWVIDTVMTKADVGRYGLAASLVNSSAVVLVSVLGQFVTPIIFGKFSHPSIEEQSKGRQLIRLNTVITVVIFVVIGVILYVAGEPIIHLLSSRAFTLEPSVLVVLAMGLGAFYAGQAMTTLGLALNKPAAYMTTKILVAIVSGLLYYIGCIWQGVFGVAVGLLVANLLYVVLVFRVNRLLQKGAVTAAA